MKEVGKTWQLGDLPIAVTKDSNDYIKARIGQLAVLDTLYTEQHSMGTESRHRDLTAYILSGYENDLLSMIETGGYNTLISDQGEEGEYYTVACNPTHKQALNKPFEVYKVKLELVKSPTVLVPTWPGIVYFASAGSVWRTDNFGVSKASDPTWSQLGISGISGTINSFAVDPTSDTGEVWAKTSAGHIYKYNGTTWSTALTDATVKEWNDSASVYSVLEDPVTGYIYGFAHSSGPYAQFRVYRDIHDDNGFTVFATRDFAGTYNYLRGMGDFSVYDGKISVMYISSLTSYRHRCTYYNGSTWADYTLFGSSNVDVSNFMDTVDAGTIYSTHSTTNRMLRYYVGSTYADVCSLATPVVCWSRFNHRRDMFMVNQEDNSIVRFIEDQAAPTKLYTTDDKFTTYTSQGQVSIGSTRTLSYMCPFVNSQDWDMIIYGAPNASITYPHNIFTAYGDTDLAPTGKSGAMADTAPYTDSIPYTVGGPVMNGIKFLNYTELQ